MDDEPIFEKAALLEPERNAQKDPREYIAITKFQKEAARIDPNHDWGLANNSLFLVKNNYGTVYAAETFDAKKKLGNEQFGVLIAERTQNGEASSVYLEDLDRLERSAVLNAIRLTGPCLPDKSRHEFIRQVGKLGETLHGSRHPAKILAELSLGFVPDLEGNDEFSSPNWIGPAETKPNSEQTGELMAFIKLARRKMDRDKFDGKLRDLVRDQATAEDPFGINYDYLFVQMEQWVMNDRSDPDKIEGLLRRDPVEEYDLKTSIKKPVTTEEDARDILLTIPVERMPEHRLTRANQVAEFVPVDGIVGGNNMKNWLVSDVGGRGIGNIFKLMRGLESGEVNVTGRDGANPISLTEINGKFYVTGDGRHRVAALKALGVENIPALVSHAV